MLQRGSELAHAIHIHFDRHPVLVDLAFQFDRIVGAEVLALPPIIIDIDAVLWSFLRERRQLQRLELVFAVAAFAGCGALFAWNGTAPGFLPIAAALAGLGIAM